jgi:hypothetical protein
MKKLKIIVFIIMLITAIGLIQDECNTPEHIYQGKVIDAETLKPVEGVLVMALWTKDRFISMFASCKVKNAMETLTDKNGEWTITGPEGNHSKLGWIFQYFGFYRSQDPLFEIYKPGLTRLVEYGNFTAYPYVSKEGDLIGIIFEKPGNSQEEARKYFEKYRTMFLPFIPIDNPEKRLRELDFSFEYPEKTDTLNSTWCTNNNVKPYWLYTVIGLRKTKTKKEREMALDLSLAGGCEFPSKIKIPIFHRIEREEMDQLFGSSKGR